MLAVAETGVRPSEICNLLPEHIVLDADVPYITIDFRDDPEMSRELKTEHSRCEIPLVGIALDQPRSETCRQIALAIREEVIDLEKAGIGIIQIDEPALREGLPLRQADWDIYLRWAVDCFRLSASGVADDTQIHTHMCYAEFNDIMPAIAEMDADVISIETSRSDMELLEAFRDFKYPNEIGPGVWDIHSPRVPDQSDMEALLRKAAEGIPAEQIWVNPDCGLKTRGWPEVKASLTNLVNTAKILRG